VGGGGWVVVGDLVLVVGGSRLRDAVSRLMEVGGE